MNELQAYFKNKHSTIRDDYKTPDKKSYESCSFIAIEVADILFKMGKKPFLVTYQDGELLQPVVLKNARWGLHIVCCCDDLAYDPILEKPIEIKDYSQRIFNNKIQPRRTMSTAELQREVAKLNE